MAHLLARPVSTVQMRHPARHAFVEYGNAWYSRAVLCVLLRHVLCELCCSCGAALLRQHAVEHYEVGLLGELLEAAELAVQ